MEIPISMYTKQKAEIKNQSSLHRGLDTVKPFEDMLLHIQFCSLCKWKRSWQLFIYRCVLCI